MAMRVSDPTVLARRVARMRHVKFRARRGALAVVIALVAFAALATGNSMVRCGVR